MAKTAKWAALSLPICLQPEVCAQSARLRTLLRLLFLFLLLGSLPASAQLAYVTKCSGASSCTPTAAAGTLHIAFAGRDGSATHATVPAGWYGAAGDGVAFISINGTSTADSSLVVTCKVATGTNEASGTFTNSGAFILMVYSGQAAGDTASCNTILGSIVKSTTAIGSGACAAPCTDSGATTTTTEIFKAVTAGQLGSWVVGLGYAPAATAGLNGTMAPDVWTQRAYQGVVLVGKDTNGIVASTADATLTFTTTSRFMGMAFELKALAAATPTFSGDSSGNNDASVTISTTTASAAICYTTDGSTPTTTAAGTCAGAPTSTYSTPVTVGATGTAVKAIASKSGLADSAVGTSNTITLTVGAVSSLPGAGSYYSAQTVTLSVATTTGSSIHYTTDNSAPGCPSTGTLYSGGFSVSSTSHVRAIGCKANYVASAPIDDTYTIGPAQKTATETCGTNDSTACIAHIYPSLLGETSTSSDGASVTKIGGATQKTATETATASASATRAVKRVLAGTATATSSESATGVRLGTLFPKTAAETFGASDSAADAVTRLRTASETSAASEAAVIQNHHMLAVQTVTASESAAWTPKRVVTATDTATAATSTGTATNLGPYTPAVQTATAAETAHASDFATGSKLTVQWRGASETSGASDSLGCRGKILASSTLLSETAHVADSATVTPITDGCTTYAGPWENPTASDIAIVNRFTATPTAFRPVADGATEQWTNNGGTSCASATCYTQVNETSGSSCTSPVASDGATLANKSGTTANVTQTYRLDLSSIPNGVTVTDVTVHACAIRTGSGASAELAYVLNGGGYTPCVTTFAPGAAYGNTSCSFTLNWIKGGSDVLEIGVRNRTSSPQRGTNVSAIAAVITYQNTVKAASENPRAVDTATTRVKYIKAAVETSGSSDSAIVGLHVSKTAGDTAHAIESATASRRTALLASASAAASEAAVKKYFVIRQATETAHAVEFAAPRLGAQRTAGEAAHAVESATLVRRAVFAALENAIAADSAIKTIHSVKAASEGAHASDAAAKTILAIRAAAETQTALDSNAVVNKTAQGSNNRFANENATINASATAKLSAQRTASESVSATESAQMVANHKLTAADSSHASATATGNRVVVGPSHLTAAEASTASDSAQRIAMFVTPASETARAADSAIVRLNPSLHKQVIIMEGRNRICDKQLPFCSH